MQIYSKQENEKNTYDNSDKIIKDCPIYILYPQRWFVLMAYCLLVFITITSYIQYTPMINLAAKYYGVSSNSIIWISNIFQLVYCLLGPSAISPLQKRLDLYLIFASFLTLIGQWIKYLAYQNYAISFIGFTLLAFSTLFYVPAPPFISNKWFAVHESTLSTSIGMFSYSAGMNFAILYSCLNEQSFAGITEMNLIYAIATTVIFLLSILCIRNQPPTPPSQQQSIQNRSSVIDSIKYILKNKNGILTLIALSFITGISWSYVVLLDILLEPYHYSTLQVGLVAFFYNVTGCVGGIFASIYIDIGLQKNIQPNYNIFIKSLISIGFFGMLIQILIIQISNYLTIIILSAVIGFGLNSFLPIAVQGLIEINYPTSELVVITLFMQGSNLFQILINTILITDSFRTYSLLLLFCMMIPFYLYEIMGSKIIYNRFNAKK